MQIRRFNIEEDSEQLWKIVESVIRTGDTWVFSPESSKEKILDYWAATDKFTFVVEIENEVAGIFFFKANQPDLGSHVANAGYMVHEDHRGKGIAEKMCRFSMQEAKKEGFLAMQFNIVIATNEGAIRIWKKCGFEIIGRLPKAFKHQKLGYVDAFVMYQLL